MEHSYKYKAKVVKVVDGDTIDAMIDLGFDIWIKRRIRLYGINTPETRTTDLDEKTRGVAAKDRLLNLIEENDNQILIESHGLEKYGRCLATIFCKEININKLLLEEGHAISFMQKELL